MSRLIAGNRSHIAALGGRLNNLATQNVWTRTPMVAIAAASPASSPSTPAMTTTTTTTATTKTTKRYMSDNLLGYNPMAGNTSSNKNVGGKKDDDPTKKKKPTGPIIGVDSNTEGGGVWAQTSAKRDKLGELRLELNWDKGERTLDDAATEEEKKDLFLIDGIATVASLVDGKHIANVDTDQHRSTVGKLSDLVEFSSLLEDYKLDILKSEGGSSSSSSSSSSGDKDSDSTEIDHPKFEAHVSHLLTHVRNMATSHHFNAWDGDNSSPPPFLIHLRDIMLFTQPTDAKTIPDRIQKEMATSIGDDSLNECVVYFRILLLEAVLQYLLEQWDVLLQVSDADMDRAATKGETLDRPNTVSLSKIHAVLRAFATGSCNDRLQAMWDLMDKDNDGMLDQSEMDMVVEMTLKPVEDALRAFVTDSVHVWPMRAELPSSFDETQQQYGDLQQNLAEVQQKKGRYRRWKDNRKEKKAQKNFIWAMDRAVKRHFDIDVETPHRLRCVYAWAEKKHQDGKLESVLVDDGLAGRKRYVELDPKISYEEFREVQQEHFGHLDRAAEELCTSLKEELWILQGKRRQNQELKREGSAFLAVVALIDFAIMTA